MGCRAAAPWAIFSRESAEQLLYVFKPPRELAEIDAELKGVTDRILTMIGGLSK